MARNIVNDYIEYEHSYLKEYIDIITEKKLNTKISDIIIETYINIRYYDNYEHIKKYPIDNIEYYVIENFKKYNNSKNIEKNISLIIDVLIILRYVVLYEKYNKDKSAAKYLNGYEEKLRKKYDNTKIVINNLIKLIKDNTRRKEKFLNNLLSNDFMVIKNNTNITNVIDLFLESNVKIPDLFSEIAINRVYNNGIIYEDRMLVLYLLTEREILMDMVKFDNDNKYIIDFPHSLIGKRNKLLNLLKLIDNDYLKERMVLKINYSEYLEKKDDYDKLIHDGYSLAVIIDDDIKDNMVLLNIFAYIIIEDIRYKKELDNFDNLVILK